MLETLKLTVNLFLSRMFRVFSIVLIVVALIMLLQGQLGNMLIALVFAFFAVWMEVYPTISVVDGDND